MARRRLTVRGVACRFPPPIVPPLEALMAAVEVSMGPDAFKEAEERSRVLRAEDALAIAFPDPRIARLAGLAGSPAAD